MIDRRSALSGLAICAGSLALPRAAIAQSFPSRPVTIVVPFAAGGGTDVLARLIGQKLGEVMNATFVVENRAGAGGAIGARAVVAAQADGHTILIGTAGTQAVNPALNPNAGFDPRKDLVPIARLGATPNILVVHPQVSAKTLSEFVTFAKSNPNKLNYASSGNGTVSHLTAALFNRAAGLDMTHVAYRGAGPANNDLVAGVVQAMFDAPISLMPLIQAGSVRALGVTGQTRLASLPDVPTMIEAGFPTVQSEVWLGVFAPKATPADIVDRLQRAIKGVIALPEITARMRQLGFEPAFGGPPDLAALLDRDLDRWSQLIKAAGIKAE